MSVYIPRGIRNQVEADAGGRCGYCKSLNELLGAPLEIEHIEPRSVGASTESNNLWVACRSCNSFKADRLSGSDPISGKTVNFFNPRFQNWNQHFQWSGGGLKIEGKTEIGRATVEALRMNHRFITSARRIWIASGMHPPDE